jgi:ATP-dependent RNA helicase DHX29
VTHVIVDEVHERQWQIDVLLISLRKLLSGPRPDLKVVLVRFASAWIVHVSCLCLPPSPTTILQMSATLDSKLFCSYFGGAPLVSVPGRTHPVTNYYLEDLIEETGHIIEEDSVFTRRDRNWKDDEATIWVSSRGGEKKKETHALLHERELSGDFEGYSIATQRYVPS